MVDMPTTPLSVLRFRLIFGICWLVLITDHAMVMGLYGLPWKEALTDSLISNLLLLLPCLLIINTLHYYLPQRNSYLNIFVSCLVLTIITIAISKYLLALMLDDFPGYSALLSRSIPIRFSLALLLLGCVTMISVLWFQWQEQKQQEIRKADAEKLAKEAELFKLRQQLQPHFLFNSLNSINSLISSRPAEARKMVQQLSDFLRGTLKKEEGQLVTLLEELEYLGLYLDIEKLRFGSRLITTIGMSEDAEKLQLPSLILQPVVENAIKFGLYDTLGETAININAFKEDDDLKIEVSNPFDPETSTHRRGTGFGLSSIERRLYLLYARQDLLDIRQEGGKFTTILRIPQLKRDAIINKNPGA